VRRDHPRAEHGKGVERLSQAPLFRTTQCHVQSDTIASHQIHRLRLGGSIRFLSDDYSKFDFVIVSSFGMPCDDTMTGSHEGTRSLLETVRFFGSLRSG